MPVPTSPKPISPFVTVEAPSVEDLVEEGAAPVRSRPAEELRGGRVLHHAALVHEDDAVSYRAREAHLMGDHEHSHALPGERRHHVEHLTDHLGIEGRGRL